MTSRNLNLKKNKPFLLKPATKDYLWGGNRLNQDFSKQIELSPLAETWECSTHSDGLSIVASGKYLGASLREVLKQHPEYMGWNVAENGELPILIKFIDAKKDLSVQVHPSDDYAQEFENGQLGKTEMWYVVDAVKEAKLIYGFQHDVNREQVTRSIADGTIMQLLQKISVHKNDVFFIQAGTVHAIGAGTLIAEIQENSNLTYRLYDYDRLDKAGRKRKLDIEKALDVAELHAATNPRQPMRVLKYRPGTATEFLCRCKYFQVERQLINTSRCRQMAQIETNEGSFQVLLCVEGCGTLFLEDDTVIRFFRGDCIFIPADSMNIYLHGEAAILKVSC